MNCKVVKDYYWLNSLISVSNKTIILGTREINANTVSINKYENYLRQTCLDVLKKWQLLLTPGHQVPPCRTHCSYDLTIIIINKHETLLKNTHFYLNIQMQNKNK